ncbi:LrgB family protein [Nocardioidaceae bacterium]|nr:LrgB family protein [Nocardioidaceae bacterium]
MTLGAYEVGRWLQRRTGGHALAQPVLVAIVLVGAVLLLTGTSYDDYLSGASLIAFLLGPATVALALPLHREMARVRRAAPAVLCAVAAGAVTSVVTAILVTQLLGAPQEVAAAASAKATTTPVAIALSAEVGGIPALAAVLAITAGIMGAVAAPALLTLLRIRDARARGLAMGAVSHGIGTSRSLAEGRTEGAFSGLSMGLTALATAAVLPPLAGLLLR